MPTAPERIPQLTQPPDDATCPFCLHLQNGPLTDDAEHAAAFPDAFPVNRGHHLLVPRRHVVDFFDLTIDEQAEIWRMLARLRNVLHETHAPAGFNVGINAGQAAGQTIAHAHMHLIPRYDGDVKDPRGGVRWVVPSKARYWQDEGA